MCIKYEELSTLLLFIGTILEISLNFINSMLYEFKMTNFNAVLTLLMNVAQTNLLSNTPKNGYPFLIHLESEVLGMDREATVISIRKAKLKKLNKKT